MGRRLGLVLLLALLAAPLHGADRPHVYLVVVDGLDARLVSAARMPRLFATLARDPERSSMFPVARAVMPTRTNPNHVSLLTGVSPREHGITGNASWSRVAGEAPRKLEDAAAIEVQTLFTVAKAHAPELVTVGAFAKSKLARLFSTVPGRQRAPDRVWSSDAPSGEDAETMTAALGMMERPEPDLAVICLAGVDRAGHRFGPDGPEYERAVVAADAAIGQLVDQLHSLGRWGRSVLVVTADHGFSAVGPTGDRPYPLITFGRDLVRAKITGVHVVDDGRIEHVYADGLGADGLAADGPLPEDAGRTLARVAELAAGTPGVAEVLARVPVHGVAALATAHPEWHLGHPRSGELVLVAARGYHFVDPFDPEAAAFLGNHGGPEETAVPLFVTGGAPQLSAAAAGAASPETIDVAPTIAVLLGLPAPLRLDGSPIPAELAGRVLGSVLARAGQSPH